MKNYDIIAIGAGAGLEIVIKALSAGLKVALLDKGNVGGTCLNVGCVPSKMLIYPADRIREIGEAKKLGIHARIVHIDFRSIMERMRKAVKSGVNSITKEIRNSQNLDFYNAEAHFVGEYVLEMKNERIRGEKFFIVSGARPIIPPINGLDKIEYLTNETVLELKRRPESLIIIGGGYIAAEYGHFFSAMGTKVVIVGKNKRLIPNEEPEISNLAKKELGKLMRIYTGTEVLEVRRRRKGYAVLVKKINTGEQKEIMAEKVMVAVGRESNADFLKVQNTGVETTEAHYVKVNDYLQTTEKNIWALGDALGRQMFTHAASEEVELAWHNATADCLGGAYRRAGEKGIRNSGRKNKVLQYGKRRSHDGRRGFCKGNRGKRDPKDFGISYHRP